MKNTLLVSIVTSFITTFMGSALTLSIPGISEELNANSGSVSWIVTVYMMAGALFTIPFGKLADIFCRKTILDIGLLLFALSSAGSGFAGKLWMLIIFRFIQGLGASMIFSTNLAILANAYSKKGKGRALGYATAANYAGLSAGPVIGGSLNFYFGWQSIFFVTAAISGALVVFSRTKLPADRVSSKITKCFFKELWTSLKNLIKGNLSFRRCCIAAFFCYGAVFGANYLISLFLQKGLGYSSGKAGLILITAPIVQAVLSPLTGRLSDSKYGKYLMLSGGFFIGLSLIMYAFLGKTSKISYILASQVLTGVGVALFSTPNTNSALKYCDDVNYGLATSALATARSLGHTVFMWIIGFYIEKMPKM